MLSLPVRAFIHLSVLHSQPSNRRREGEGRETRAEALQTPLLAVGVAPREPEVLRHRWITDPPGSHRDPSVSLIPLGRVLTQSCGPIPGGGAGGKAGRLQERASSRGPCGHPVDGTLLQRAGREVSVCRVSPSTLRQARELDQAHPAWPGEPSCRVWMGRGGTGATAGRGVVTGSSGGALPA